MLYSKYQSTICKAYMKCIICNVLQCLAKTLSCLSLSYPKKVSVSIHKKKYPLALMKCTIAYHPFFFHIYLYLYIKVV